MTSYFEHLATNTKAVFTVAAGTIGSGLGLAMGWLSDGLGPAATVVGIVLSLVMIRRGRIEARKLELEIEILQEQQRRERRVNARGDDLSPFGRVAESLEVSPGNKRKPD